MTVTIRATPERVDRASVGQSARSGRPGDGGGGGFGDLLDAIAAGGRPVRSTAAPVQTAAGIERPVRATAPPRTDEPRGDARRPSSADDDPPAGHRSEDTGPTTPAASDRPAPDNQPIDVAPEASGPMTSPIDDPAVETTCPDDETCGEAPAGGSASEDGDALLVAGNASDSPDLPAVRLDGTHHDAPRAIADVAGSRGPGPGSTMTGALESEAAGGDPPPARSARAAEANRATAAPVASEDPPHPDRLPATTGSARFGAGTGNEQVVGGEAGDGRFDVADHANRRDSDTGLEMSRPASTDRGQPGPPAAPGLLDDSIAERLTRSGVKSRRLDERSRAEARAILSQVLGAGHASEVTPVSAGARPHTDGTESWRPGSPAAVARAIPAGAWSLAAGPWSDQEPDVDDEGIGVRQGADAGLEESAEEIVDAVLSSTVGSRRPGSPTGPGDRPEPSRATSGDSRGVGTTAIDPNATWAPTAGGRAGVATGTPLGPSAATADDTSAAVRDQMVRAVTLAWRNGVGEARLRLKPDHLGEVVVHVRVAQGAVQAVVHAQTVEARDRIHAHEAELRNALSEQGLDLDRLAVTLDPDDRQGQSEPRRRPIARFSKRAPNEHGPHFTVSA